jgi:hypothetical protein
MNNDNLCLQIKAIRALKPHQHNALHAFRHKLVGAIHDLYQVMPADEVDPILDNFLREAPAPTEALKKAIDKVRGQE